MNNQLAVLMGKSPAEAHIAAISLDQVQLPQELPLSLPSSLARQRPDIRAAESLLHQASANVGVATADRYPQIVLTGSGGGAGTGFRRVAAFGMLDCRWQSLIYNGGALRAEQRQG